MRSATALFLLFAAACGGNDASPTDTPPNYEPPLPIDTGWPPGDIGSLEIVHHVNDGSTQVYGVFTQSSPGFQNLAQCSVDNTICIGRFPSDEDDWEDLDPDAELEQDTVVTRFAGFDIEYGPYTLPYRENPDTKFGYYSYDATGEELPEGWIAATFGGQWPEYEGERDLFVSPPIELVQPAIDSHITFTNGEKVPFEWVPTGRGIVTLNVFTRFTLSRIYKLEDDGYFELDADSLGLNGDTEDLTFLFTRWDIQEKVIAGNVISFVSSSDAFFSGQYIQIGARLPLIVADACDEALGRAPLEAGGWWGYLGGAINNDLDPNNNCIKGLNADAIGNDGMFRMDVGPRHSVSVDYNTFDQSASVYFMNDCHNVNSCFIGNDQSVDPNVHEFLNYFNPDDEQKSIYLVLDMTTAGPSIFTLDVTDEELTPPDMYDTCTLAQAATPTLTSANYYADFFAFTDKVNPGSGGCTGTSLPGPDAMTPVTLGSGQTIDVNISMPGGDPAIYLLYNCVDAFSCPIGADLSLGQNEQLSYTNLGAGTENLYLVVDSKTGLLPYFLGVNIY